MTGKRQPSEATNQQALSRPAHALPYETVIEELAADATNGLTDGEAKSRLEKYGRNELDEGPGVQPVKILIRQVANAMMLVKHTMSPFTYIGGTDVVV